MACFTGSGLQGVLGSQASQELHGNGDSVAGIGFLGAGTILRGDGVVVGITTAATIWAVAAIGLAVGAGLYLVAIVTTVIALIALRVLAPPRHHDG